MILLVIPLLVLVACGEETQPATSMPAIYPAEGDIVVDPTLPPPVVVSDGSVAEPTEESSEPSQGEIPADQSVGPWSAGDFGYGAQSHAVVGDPKFAMDVMSNQLGLVWAKVQLEWPLVQPDPETYQWFFYDGVVDEAHAHGLRMMFSVVGAPAWTRAAGNENGPPDD